MKVLMLNGSPKKNGNTAIALSEVKCTLENEGIEVCYFDIGALAVRVTTGADDAHAPARRAYEKAGFEKSLSSVTYYKKL